MSSNERDEQAQLERERQEQMQREQERASLSRDQQAGDNETSNNPVIINR